MTDGKRPWQGDGGVPSHKMARRGPDAHAHEKAGKTEKTEKTGKPKPGTPGAPTPRNAYTPMFERFRDQLDAHHDRRERVVKASRDVTALSKKVIFALQRVRRMRAALPGDVEGEVARRLAEIGRLLAGIAPEMQGLNRGRYGRVLFGMEELLEALTFLHYLRSAVDGLSSSPPTKEHLLSSSPPAERGHRRGSSRSSHSYPGVRNINELEAEGTELELAIETQFTGWKINTSSSTVEDKEILKKLLTTPPVRKIDLHFPLGLEVTARNMKGVTIKDALDAIHKAFKKRSDDELDLAYLKGFEWDKDECWTRLIVHLTNQPTGQGAGGSGGGKKKSKKAASE